MARREAPGHVERKNAGSLWRHRDFLKLWAGRTISVFGTRLDALTYCAVLTTAASPSQLGWLGALSGAPVLLPSLSAGASVDRLRRRPLMIAADLSRAALLGSIPLAALMGGLTLLQVFVVAIVSSAVGLVFDIADHAYLPTLVAPARLIEGNSKLEAGAEVVELAAPAAGGGLVQALSAPLAVLVDAFTFLISSPGTGRCRHAHRRRGVGRPARSAHGRAGRAQVRAGPRHHRNGSAGGCRRALHAPCGRTSAAGDRHDGRCAIPGRPVRRGPGDHRSLRQSLVPDRLLGRVAAGTKLLVGGVAPLGALAAGTLATFVSSRYAILVAVGGLALSNLWLIFSPLLRLRTMPARRES